MRTLKDFTEQSRWTDPGRYAPLLDELPRDIGELAAVVRNTTVHYWGTDGVMPDPARRGEVDLRRLDLRLAADQQRFGTPLAVPRPTAERISGCCRDFTLLTVAALRHQGVPARSRIGFASYFEPGFHHDHVVAEYWNGDRWVLLDSQLTPGPPWDFDTADLPPLIAAGHPGEAPFSSAAQVWTAFRRGTLDAESYGVPPEHAPGPPLRGGWFVRNYVLQELAHRQGDELLLWDSWGEMSLQLDGDLALVDEVAALLVAADGGDARAERELADRYRGDPRLHPGESVLSYSPTGAQYTVDLRSTATR
jgi:hypothetical protein